MIVIVSAGERIPSNPELDKVTAFFGAETWHQITLGSGPQGDSDFVRHNDETFAEKLHSAVLRIIDEMRDEVAKELLRT